MGVFVTIGGWLDSITTALTAVDTGANIGQRVARGVKQNRLHAAASRVQPSPQRAAHWFTAALRNSGHPAVARPGLVDGTWVLVAEYDRDTGQRPPPTFEGYPVQFQVKTTRRERKAAALSSVGAVDVPAAVDALGRAWLGRAGVISVRDDMWREGPVLIVSVLGGKRPPGLPKKFKGLQVIVVPGRVVQAEDRAAQ